MSYRFIDPTELLSDKHIRMNPNKVQIFWEGHKILQNPYIRFERLLLVKSKMVIPQFFFAFLQSLNMIFGTWIKISVKPRPRQDLVRGFE